MTNQQPADERGNANSPKDGDAAISHEILVSSSPFADFSFWPIQREMLQALSKFMESGGRSGYVRSPTQTGKGIVELALVAALNVPTLIVTWSRKSLAQLLDNSSAHLCSSKVAAFGIS